jgi:predicted HAD superfamily Cof-like phosphohydrolase
MNKKTKSKLVEYVETFHKTYSQPVRTVPRLPDEPERKLRRSLLAEEYTEYMVAEENNDLVEIADGLVDMLYIISGTAHAYGIPLDDILDEVQASNMSKLGEDGKPIYREDGKILKGPNFFRPDIKKILCSYGYIENINAKKD